MFKSVILAEALRDALDAVMPLSDEVNVDGHEAEEE